ncbi:MAG: tRNA (adenosine(37)-N6)-threonylcarbamoyltransferase complex ATPase subunit type 1 TsaE [Gammaproteobacteria bacterium]|nr:MAG: tRNA (adenosine(37)-N6)-threonylcarbamoyltransferase complex ATPase subunit type 1 TsaE [Gammaproteobacteria bacterium]
MSAPVVLQLADEVATRALGAALARAATGGGVFLLHGDLGAGKTTLARGFLRARGYDGVVRSPTYTLLEPYPLATGAVYHLDLYRLADVEELEYLGLRDLDEPEATFLVEWPEHGRGALPTADLEVTLDYAGSGRQATIIPLSQRGAAWQISFARPDQERKMAAKQDQ